MMLRVEARLIFNSLADSEACRLVGGPSYASYNEKASGKRFPRFGSLPHLMGEGL